MKNIINKTYLTLLIILSNLLIINAQDLASNSNSDYTNSNKLKGENQTVYICTGQYAYAYHSRSNCPGLSNCGDQIIPTDEETALNSRQNKPCCRCWSNVINNCKDDNPTYGGSANGGGGNEGSAVALGIIFGSAIILSNDIYVYRVSSFFSKNSTKDNSRVTSGWAFGFRKTFEKSALEYGISLMEIDRISYYNNYRSVSEYYGLHLNYIHKIFDSKMPDNLSIYLGPSINKIDGIGYGAIISTQYKIFNRLKLDLRYEATTQTNQVQLGLIFNYQRKYFWQ